jgi:hypothetical protein
MTDRHFGEALDRWLTTEPEPSPCPSPCSVCGPDGCDPECSVCEAENAARAEHDEAGPGHAGWCPGPSTHYRPEAGR